MSDAHVSKSKSELLVTPRRIALNTAALVFLSGGPRREEKEGDMDEKEGDMDEKEGDIEEKEGDMDEKNA